MQIYVKKITSLHPTKYKFITLDEAQRKYWLYIQSSIKYTQVNNKIKNLREWLATEI